MGARLPTTLEPRNRWSTAAILAGVAVAAITTSGAAAEAVRSTYEDFQRAFSAQRPDAAQTARVKGLVLTRDAGRFELKDGVMVLGSPVGGRVRGAIFVGQGTFTFEPPDRVEQAELARFYQSRVLRRDFESLVVLFADSTLDELDRGLRFAPGDIPEAAARRLALALSYVRVERTRWIDPGLARPMLEDRNNGYFFSCMQGAKGEPLMLEIDPLAAEEVRLWRKPVSAPAGAKETTPRDLVSSCGRSGSRPADDQGKLSLKVQHVRLDCRITEDGQFAAEAELRCESLESGGSWRAFGLFSRFTVDSAAWEDGRPAEFYKGPESDQLWVHWVPPQNDGRERRLRLWYRGKLIERDGGWFVLRTSYAWFPRFARSTPSTFDLTFRTPNTLRFACVGDSIGTERGPSETVSRWRVSPPTRNVSFNLGFFKEYRVQAPHLPPVVVLMVEGVHEELARELLKHGELSGTGMEKQVAADVVNSLSFFNSVYGPLSVGSILATEIPFEHGEAFRGFVHLSWSTFQRTLGSGEDEIFRAHEVAHQWWGIGVDFATYHDQWLSEGFAHFSAIWYLQMVRKDNQRYLNLLKEWKKQILDEHRFLVGRQTAPGPIWLGYRSATQETPGDYDRMVYRKGAWVLHMLRNLLIDLQTSREDRFIGLMREFFATYSGTTATTEDFRRLAEKYAGEDLGWFFDQWVYGTEIPSYRFAYQTERTPEGQYRVKCRVEQKAAGERFRMVVPIRIDLEGDQFARVRVLVEGPKAEFELPLLPTAPRGVVFNDLESVLCEVEKAKW